MRRRRFQRGGLSQRKRNSRLFWYLQWREDGQPRSKELGLCSEMTRAQAEVMRTAILEPVNNGLLKPAKTGLHVRSLHRGGLLASESAALEGVNGYDD